MLRSPIAREGADAERLNPLSIDEKLPRPRVGRPKTSSGRMLRTLQRRLRVSAPAAIAIVYFCVMLSLMAVARIAPVAQKPTLVVQAQASSPSSREGTASRGSSSSFTDAEAELLPVLRETVVAHPLPLLARHRGVPEAAWECLERLACSSSSSGGGSSRVPPSETACSAGAGAWFRVLPADGATSGNASRAAAISAAGARVLVPLAAWTGLWGAAWSALAQRLPCRGTTFPVRAANEQFSASAYMGDAALQRKHGLALAPFFAYEGGAIAAELDAQALCAVGAAVRATRPAAGAAPKTPQRVGAGGGTGAAMVPARCSDLTAAGIFSSLCPSAAAAGAPVPPEEWGRLRDLLWSLRPQDPSLTLVLTRDALQLGVAGSGSRLWSLLLEGLGHTPRGNGTSSVRASNAAVTAALTRGYAAALDSTVDILLHNRAGLAASIRRPASGSPYIFAAAEEVAALAEGTEDVQRVARAYMPRGKGDRLPHFALAFNVFIMPSGSILSLDDLLLTTAAHSQPGSKRCALPTLVSMEPIELTDMRRDTMNSFLHSMLVPGVKFSPPTVEDVLSGRWTPSTTKKGDPGGKAVTPAMYVGEVPADPELLCAAANTCGSSDAGARARISRDPCAKPASGGPPARGWVCAVRHDTVHSSAAAASSSRDLPAAAQLIVSWGAGPPSPAVLTSTCIGQTAAAASDGTPVCKAAPAAKEDGPLPAHVPVFDDVFVLGGGNHKNFYWFEADTGGMMAHVAPFLRAFPGAVIHVGAATAKLWGGMHLNTLSAWGIHPSRVVFGPLLARRLHLLDKPTSGRPHPLAAVAMADAALGKLSPDVRAEAHVAHLGHFSAATTAGKQQRATPDPSAPTAVLVTRSDSKERHLVNSVAVADLLSAAGAKVVYYSQDGTDAGMPPPLLQGFEIFAKADLLVGAHGAAFTNALVMRPGATLLDFIPEGHAGTGLMYAYLPRFIASPACPALLGLSGLGGGGSGPAADTSAAFVALQKLEAAGGGRTRGISGRPAAPTAGLPGAFSGCLPTSLEYHQILVPGTKVSPTISADLRVAGPWLVCAVARAKRTPGAPSCAALGRAWGASTGAASPRSIQRYVLAGAGDASGTAVPALPSLAGPAASSAQKHQVLPLKSSAVPARPGAAQSASASARVPPAAAAAGATAWGAAAGRELLALPATAATAAPPNSRDATSLPPGAPVPPHLWGLVYPLLAHRPPLPPPLDRTPALGPGEPLYALRPLAGVLRAGSVPAGLDLSDAWLADDGVAGGVALGTARGLALLLPGSQHRGEVWATSATSRPVIRALTRRGVLPVAVGPLASAAWERGQPAPPRGADSWQSGVECDAAGVPTGDAARLVGIVQAMQAAIRAAAPPLGATGGGAVPVYVSCVDEGCSAALQLLLPYIQLAGVHAVSWVPLELPMGSAGTRAKALDAAGLWLLPASTSPCPHPHPALSSAPVPPAARVLPPLAVVSMAREYSALAGVEAASLKDRWQAYLQAGVPASALAEAHLTMQALHPLSAFDAMPWLVSPGVAAAWWGALCSRGILTLNADTASAEPPQRPQERSPATPTVAPPQAGAAEHSDSVDPALQVECGLAASRVLSEGSGSTLPLAWVTVNNAEASAAVGSALEAVLADSAVVELPRGDGGEDARKGQPPPPSRLILASEASAYTSAGWRVQAAPAWPVDGLPPTLLRDPAAGGWLALDSPASGGGGAGDVVRVAARNMRGLVSEAAGFRGNSGSGRWAENAAAWLVDHWAAAAAAGKRRVGA